MYTCIVLDELHFVLALLDKLLELHEADLSLDGFLLKFRNQGANGTGIIRLETVREWHHAHFAEVRACVGAGTCV